MKSHSRLRMDGYYCAKNVVQEEWHAGVLMRDVNHHYVRFYENGDWLGCYRDHEFDFWEFSEQVTADLFAAAKQDRAPRVGNDDPLCTAGSYTVEGLYVVRKRVIPWAGGLEWTARYELAEDRLVHVDDDGAAGGTEDKRDGDGILKRISGFFGYAKTQKKHGQEWLFQGCG